VVSSRGLLWLFTCSCEACLPVIPKTPMRCDTICGGEGQRESRERTNCKRTMMSGPIGPIYCRSVAGRESDACKNKVREGTDPHNDVESKRVVGCTSCDVGMMAVKVAHSCGAAGEK